MFTSFCRPWLKTVACVGLLLYSCLLPVCWWLVSLLTSGRSWVWPAKSGCAWYHSGAMPLEWHPRFTLFIGRLRDLVTKKNSSGVTAFRFKSKFFCGLSTNQQYGLEGSIFFTWASPFRALPINLRHCLNLERRSRTNGSLGKNNDDAIWKCNLAFLISFFHSSKILAKY